MSLDLWYQVRRLADLDPVKIDGWVFRLHYWITSTGIFAASAVAFAKQYFGDPIECIFVSTRCIKLHLFITPLFPRLITAGVASKKGLCLLSKRLLQQSRVSH